MVKHLLLILIVIFTTQQYSAATSPITALVKKKYSGTTHLTTEFEQSIYWSVREKTSKKRGTVTFAPNNKFRVELSNETLVSNGTTYWQYSQSNNQLVIRQLSDLDLSVQPSHMLSTFLTKYQFKVTHNNKKYSTLVWKATSSSNHDYQSITLTVLRESGTITSLEFTDNNKNIHTYTFKKTTFGKAVPVKTFEFEAPPNAHIIDNRQ